MDPRKGPFESFFNKYFYFFIFFFKIKIDTFFKKNLFFLVWNFLKRAVNSLLLRAFLVYFGPPMLGIFSIGGVEELGDT